MGNPFKGEAAHSAAYFGDTRDHWWNLDFLRLMAQRWKLDAVRDVLDVGCGVGHWSMLLASVMPGDVRVTGIDREPSWIEEARARAAARGVDGRFAYRQGDAVRLPFPDDSFDLTTCQTVLIHLPAPAAAIAEMVRVTRPGGLVAVAEPNNLTSALLLDSVSNQAAVDEIVELVRFQLTCERGKIALGEGDNSLGDRVPGLFAAQGLENIETHLNDRVTAVFPPYAAVAQRAAVDEARDGVATRFWYWSESDTRRYFLAGGGVEADLGIHFGRALASAERIVRGLDDATYHGVVGGAFYLVAGRKSEREASSK
jgi:SAM-dependent methyltransferase